MPADLMIYALVAAGLVFWLRNILGTRNGSERERPNPFTSQPDDVEKTLTNIKKIVDEDASGAAAGLAPGMPAQLDRNMSIAPAAEAGLAAIAAADRSFETLSFMRGAQDAFVMVVEAFARGDKETLKPLLASPVYAAFESVIADRQTSGQTASVEIHSIRKAEIVAARMERRDALVTVRFVADETNLLHDSAGLLLHGNPDRITETIDIWTFVRDTKSREPGWLLIETSDEDAVQQDHKTVPDA